MQPQDPNQQPNNPPQPPAQPFNPPTPPISAQQPYGTSSQPNPAEQITTTQQSPNPFQPIGATKTKTHKKPLIVGLIIGGVVVFIIVLASIFFGLYVALKDSDKRDQRPSGQSSSVEELAPATDDQAAAVKTPITGKKIVTDAGYGIALDEIVTGYEPAGRKPSTQYDNYIYKVTITQEGQPKYTGSWPSAPYFNIVAGGEEISRATYSGNASISSMRIDGYPTIEVKAPKPDAPVSGYILFAVPKGKQPTTLRYKQPAASVLGSNGQSVPAKDYDLAL